MTNELKSYARRTKDYCECGHSKTWHHDPFLEMGKSECRHCMCPKYNFGEKR